MSNVNVRQAYLQYAGPYYSVVTQAYIAYHFLGPYALFNQTVSTSSSLFTNFITGQSAIGGLTDTAQAIDWVRINVFTPETYRVNARRVAVLITDGAPSDQYGDPGTAVNTAAETAASNLKTEDGVIFIYLRMADLVRGNGYIDYPTNWFQGIYDYMYSIPGGFPALPTLLTTQGFLDGVLC